ncbi:hypothetical protein [Flavobacterium flavigenum]|uniref:hypothetical protein n=1 Tax=Flavobacterium flavigenum TaxID=3003258 RepID=UPI002482AC78|nr:hypothetical protein [Flavobacterium flavigenum]
MTIYFVTYGNKKFKYSVKRIVKESRKIRIFDEVLHFSEKDLPLYIKNSTLFSSAKGGGYWLWKPFIIQKVLERAQKNDVVIYSDAGNKLFKSNKWKEYIRILENYDSIFFQYKDNMDYLWSKNNINLNDSPKLKYWIKKSAADHFQNLFSSNDQWLEKNKLVAGFFLLKKTETTLKLIDEWLKTMLFFPSIVTDLFEIEKKMQIEGFSEHRHDQSILSVLVRYYELNNDALVTDEEFESKQDNQALRTFRLIDKGGMLYSLKKMIKQNIFLRNLYQKIKK